MKLTRIQRAKDYVMVAVDNLSGTLVVLSSQDPQYQTLVRLKNELFAIALDLDLRSESGS